MHRHSIAELSKLLSQKSISSTELTQHFLKRIKQFDPLLNSFITVTEDIALMQAKEADERIAAGTHTLLTGIPIAHKDIFCTFGVKTTCASKMLDNFIAPYDATIVERLKAAGTVMLGKTNMDEFAMGSSNETSFYGAVKNPWDLSRVPGGSSGGSSAVIAAGLACATTGSDTGGSIRQPASLSGITGIKPTYGRVSRYGMIAYASSLDQAGPMARSAEDCAYLLHAMGGFDPKDSTSVDQPIPDYISQLNKPLQGLKIGVPKEFFIPELDPQIAKLIEDATVVFQKLGCQLVPIHLPNMHLSIPTYYIIAPAECSSNLARYDGARYGYRCEQPRDLYDMYTRTRAEGFGTEVKRRIMTGSYVLSSGFYDAYYLKAQKVRQLIAQDFRNAFQKVDVILGPTFPTTAFKLGEKMNDPISMYLSDIFTISTNLAGLPAIALPAGFVDSLPVGMQLIGPSFQEGLLLNAGHQYQQQTDWHRRMPEAFA